MADCGRISILAVKRLSCVKGAVALCVTEGLSFKFFRNANRRFAIHEHDQRSIHAVGNSRGAKRNSLLLPNAIHRFFGKTTKSAALNCEKAVKSKPFSRYAVETLAKIENKEYYKHSAFGVSERRKRRNKKCFFGIY